MNSQRFVMRAFAGCVCDVIATPYRLRVAIATPRIEDQTISLATMTRSARHPASTIYDVDCHSIRDDAKTRPSRLRNRPRSQMSPIFFRSLSCRAMRTAACFNRRTEGSIYGDHGDRNQSRSSCCRLLSEKGSGTNRLNQQPLASLSSNRLGSSGQRR